MIGASHRLDALLFAAAITGVLVLASSIALTLKIRIAKGEPHEVIDNLKARINAWWVIAVLVGAALSAGHAGVTVLFAFASYIALAEFTGWQTSFRGQVQPGPDCGSNRDPGPESGERHRRDCREGLALASFFLVVPAQYCAVALGAYELYSVFVPLVAFVAIPLIARVRRGTENGGRIAIVQWGLVLCVYCISFLPALLTLDIGRYNDRKAFLLLYLIVVVQGSDVLQYVWGKLAGRHKIAPALSPSKTIEGTVGGVLSAVALGTVIAPVTPFTRGEAAVIAAVIAVLGFIGGLIMSALKRRRGLKDWGTLINGHGGMLDRLDSLCLSAPAFFYIVRVGWAA